MAVDPGGTTTTGGVAVLGSGSGTGASRRGEMAGGIVGASGSTRVGSGVIAGGATRSGNATGSDFRAGVCAGAGRSSAAALIGTMLRSTAWKVERLDFIWTFLFGAVPSCVA